MVDIQMQPLDLSCPAKRPLSPGLSPSSSLSDIRRLSHGSDDAFLDRSGGSGEEWEEARAGEEGPARKRFLSKFFRDPKGRIASFPSDCFQRHFLPAMSSAVTHTPL
jgi:hypothetical protein